MYAALLVLAALLAVPSWGAEGERCGPTTDRGIEVEGPSPIVIDPLATPRSESPCDTDAPCPSSSGCCAVCASCCKLAPRMTVSHVIPEVGPSGALTLASALGKTADPGCSIWHPPRG